MVRIIQKKEMRNLSKRILVLDPHGDDGAIGCAGSLAKLSEDPETEIYYVVFSISETSVPEGFPNDIVKQECLKAFKLMNITQHEILNYPVRRLNEHRQEILEFMVNLNKSYKPDVVYLPSQFDTHQDHQTIYNEGIRAFRKNSTMYGFDMPWNTMETHIHLLEILTDDHIKKKVEFINCFQSQMTKGNPVLREQKVRAHAMDRGSIVASEFAEAFQVIREIHG